MRPNPSRLDDSFGSQIATIAPSILKVDFADLAEEVRRLEAADAKLLHWDVMDGNFVPNLSYGAMVISSLRKRTELFFDAHLMIADPAKYVDEYLAAGCDSVTIHIEAAPEPAEILNRIRDAGAHAGLAINPHTPFSRIEPWLDLCDLVLVMSVQPGFGGQKFMPDVLDKVSTIRERIAPSVRLSIDGGIGSTTIAAAAAAGARLFVAGSAIFDAGDYAVAMRQLEQRASSPSES
jgi:ribulose-phosphate 3-epimerase